MNSRQRVLTAFAHQEPDRVPAWLGMSPSFKQNIKQHLRLLDDDSLALAVGDDFRRVFAQYAGPDHASPSLDLPPGATYRSVFGILRHGYEGGQPMNHPLSHAATSADVDAYPWPDPAWMDVAHIRAEAERYAGQVAILGGEWAPFWHDAIDLLGMENLLYKMFDAPAVVDAVLDHTVNFYSAVSQRIFEQAADSIDIFFIGNDFGTQIGPMISVKLFRRFLLTPLKRLIDLGHAYNLKVLLHCCGGFEPLIPAMIEAGLDGLQGLQPNCRGMDPATLKARYGADLLLMGAIDTQHVIEGSPDSVRTETRRILDLMKPGGGYVASPSHDYLLAETPVENVLALYEAVRDYGGY